MADETLLYTGKFDATGIVQGEAVADAAFNKLNATASKAFTSMDKQAATTKTSLLQLGTVGKGTGMVMQQAGYQVGDFFVQLASGQGVIRPLIQQGTQMLQVFGAWGSIVGAAAAVLGSIYVAISRTTAAAKEFNGVDLPEWLMSGSRLRYAETAMTDLASANVALTAQIHASNPVMSAASVYLIAYSQTLKDAKEAEAKFAEVVGMSTEEFNKKITQFVSFNQYVKDVTERADAKLLDINDSYTQAVINGKTNELERLEELETLAYEKSLRSTRGYYTAIRDDVKKSDAERKRAADQLQNAEATQLDTHNQNLSNIEATYYTKQSEKQKAAQDKLFDAQVTAREKEISELRAFQKTREDVNADVAIRLQEAGSGSEVGKLEARQARERQALKARLDDQAKNLDLSIAQYEDYYSALDRLAEAHALERNKVIKTEADKNTKVLHDAANDLARAYVSLGTQLASAFQIGPLQKFFGWLQQIETLLETFATIKKSNALLGGAGFLGSLFGFGGAASAGAGLAGAGEGANLLPLLALAKTNIPEAIAPVQNQGLSKGSASYTFGDINVHVPQGMDPRSVTPLVRSAVVEAAEQIEKSRNQRHYRNGTFQF